MFRKKAYAVVTKKALEKKSIGFAYRDLDIGTDDSGWRMMYDKDEDPLDLANPDKVYVCEFARLFHYFPELEEMIKGRKKYSVMEKTSDGWRQIGRDKEFSTVPHKMAGKQKFIKTLANIPMVTADPEDMHNIKKIVKEWELLIGEEDDEN